jgi:hypothetical protein
MPSLRVRHEYARGRLLHVLLHECQLVDHLRALRDVLFMADGQVISSLTHQWWRRLDQWQHHPTPLQQGQQAGDNTVDYLVFNDALQNALSVSPLCKRLLAERMRVTGIPFLLQYYLYDAEHVVCHVTVDPFPDGSTTTVGVLQRFTVHFDAPWPLKVVITDTSINMYSQVFTLLLQVFIVPTTCSCSRSERH